MFEDRDDEGIFLCYSCKTKAYLCYNKWLRKVTENANVKVDENHGQILRNYNGYPIYEN